MKSKGSKEKQNIQEKQTKCACVIDMENRFYLMETAQQTQRRCHYPRLLAVVRGSETPARTAVAVAATRVAVFHFAG